MSEEMKEVSFSISPASQDGGAKRKRGRPARRTLKKVIHEVDKEEDPVGVSVIKTESIVLKAKSGDTNPVGKKVTTQQVIKLLPKANGSLQAKTIKTDKQVVPLPSKTPLNPGVSNTGPKIQPPPAVTRKTKVAFLPKKKIMKLKLVGKPNEEHKLKPPAGTKITLPIKHKTRKCFKERKLRIEL